MPNSSPKSPENNPKPAASPQSPPPAAPATPDGKSKSKKGKVCLGFALGCLVVLLIGSILGYYVYKQVKKRAEEKLNNVSFEELEKSIANFPSTEEFDKLAADLDEDSNSTKAVSGQIGQELSDGEVAVTVDSLQHQEKMGDTTPMTDYEYVVANVTLENKSQQEISVFTSNFYLRDGNSNQYYEAYLTEGDVEQPIAAWQYLAVGQSLTGNIVFEAKKDVGDLDVIYDGEKKLEFKPTS